MEIIKILVQVIGGASFFVWFIWFFGTKINKKKFSDLTNKNILFKESNINILSSVVWKQILKQLNIANVLITNNEIIVKTNNFFAIFYYFFEYNFRIGFEDIDRVVLDKSLLGKRTIICLNKKRYNNEKLYLWLKKEKDFINILNAEGIKVVDLRGQGKS